MQSDAEGTRYIYSVIVCGRDFDSSSVWSGNNDPRLKEIIPWQDRAWKVEKKMGDYLCLKPA